MPLENLVKLSGVNLQLAVILKVEIPIDHVRDLAAYEFVKHMLANPAVSELLLVLQATSQHQAVHAGGPFVMPAGNGNRMLVFIEPKVGTRVSRVVILEIIP